MSMPLLKALDLWRKLNPDRSELTFENYRGQLSTFAVAGIRDVEDATPERVAQFLARLKLSPVTKNTKLAALTSVLSTLERADLYPFETLRKLRRLKLRLGRRRRFNARFLKPEECERLLAAARSSARPESELAIRIGLLTGLRAGELARLRWEDLSLGAKPTLRVKNGKTGPRVVPLPRELNELLRSIGREEGYVFTQERGRRGHQPELPHKSIKTLRHELQRAAARAGLEDVTWHTIRHTRASSWAKAGVSLAKIAYFLGNTPEVCAIYYAGFQPGYDADVERGSGTRTRKAVRADGRRLAKALKKRCVLATATAEARVARIARGRWQGGSAPFGYTLDENRALVLEKREAGVVRLIFEEYLRRGVVDQVVAELRSRGVFTRQRRPFHKFPVSFVLRNPVYTGRVRVAGEVLVGTHERIVDEETFAKAQELLARGGR